MASFSITGHLVDLHQRRIYPAEIEVANGIITSIREVSTAPDQYIMPGFIDAHVHIESSMLVPSEFAKLAVVHGTVATVSDPHEIGNVCGIEGIQYMIDNAGQVPFKCFFGAPSCVPATGFETAGATIDATAIDSLLSSPDIWYLAEMMNYPGVLQGDPEVLAKIASAHKHNKPVDGHAPGLIGTVAAQYAAAGITTDHECTTLEEALDKIDAGMHILIREGSAAKNFNALHPLLASHSDNVMLCSDDKHPDDLIEGHINILVQRALALGYNIYEVLRAACVHPALHYHLPVGLLRTGDPADFIILPDLATWKPSHTYINGQLVAENGTCRFQTPPIKPINNFNVCFITPEDIQATITGDSATVRAIVAHDGQLTTTETIATLHSKEGKLNSDTTQDVLKLVVINRYNAAPPAIAFIKNIGLKRGAIASTVAHDCHNIIAVGADDESLCAAINAVISARGGITVANSAEYVQCLPLPIAGLMSNKDGYETGRKYAELSRAAKDLGSTLNTPFMTLSFMALLVIPALKLSDKGLFDGRQFRFVNAVEGSI
jgi:adenine deaminase